MIPLLKHYNKIGKVKCDTKVRTACSYNSKEGMISSVGDFGKPSWWKHVLKVMTNRHDVNGKKLE